MEDPSSRWYKDYAWYNTTYGTLRCCSDTFCAMHYVGPQELFSLEHLVYHVHPFGFDKNFTETLPKKLSLQQIIAASDIKGVGRLYTDHEPVHYLNSSEIF